MTYTPPIEYLFDIDLYFRLIMDARYDYLTRHEPDATPTYREVRDFADEVIREYQDARVRYSAIIEACVSTGIETTDTLRRAIADAARLTTAVGRINAII